LPVRTKLGEGAADVVIAGGAVSAASPKLPAVARMYWNGRDWNLAWSERAASTWEGLGRQ
jgi:hypothetical protein